MISDAARWDNYHKKNTDEGAIPSPYAVEKEKLFTRNSIVLDLGGGTGNDALHFLKCGHSVILLDISQTALDLAYKKAKIGKLAKNLIVMRCDFGLNQFPVKDNSVDIVYSRISLNYFGENHTKRLFVSIYNLLKVNGWAFLTFKSPLDKEEMEILEKKGTLYEPNVFIIDGHLKSRFSKEQLEKMLTDVKIHGFKVESFTEELISSDNNTKRYLQLNEVIFTKGTA